MIRLVLISLTFAAVFSANNETETVAEKSTHHKKVHDVKHRSGMDASSDGNRINKLMKKVEKLSLNMAMLSDKVEDLRNQMSAGKGYESSPLLKPSPKNKTLSVLEGRPWRLTCEAKSNPKADIIWSRVDRRGLLEPIAMRESINSSEAVIADGGEYQCMADNNVGQPALHQFFLKVIYLRAFRVHPIEDTEDGLLECQANPDDGSSFYWTLNGTKIDLNDNSTDSRYEQHDDRMGTSLYVRNMTDEEMLKADAFECVMDTSLGQLRASTRPIELRGELGDEVEEGEDIALKQPKSIQDEPDPIEM